MPQINVESQNVVLKFDKKTNTGYVKFNNIWGNLSNVISKHFCDFENV